MELIYVPRDGFAAPPDGWPAADHTERDPEMALLKVESGWYKDKAADAKPSKKEVTPNG